MAAKYKLTRPEFKRFRDALGRYQRFLPTLQLKQQQLQMAVRDVIRELHQARQTYGAARDKFEPYRGVLNDIAGMNVSELATPDEVKTAQANIAGVNIPIFDSVTFPPAKYSLFATPAWVDQTLNDLRQLNEKKARVDITEQKYTLLQRELTKISQRVNLFEKVKIPEAKEAIRRIRIALGDEMTAAVCRSKIAKSKISQVAEHNIGETHATANEVADA